MNVTALGTWLTICLRGDSVAILYLEVWRNTDDLRIFFVYIGVCAGCCCSIRLLLDLLYTSSFSSLLLPLNSLLLILYIQFLTFPIQPTFLIRVALALGPFLVVTL